MPDFISKGNLNQGIFSSLDHWQPLRNCQVHTGSSVVVLGRFWHEPVLIILTQPKDKEIRLKIQKNRILQECVLKYVSSCTIRIVRAVDQQVLVFQMRSSSNSEVCKLFARMRRIGTDTERGFLKGRCIRIKQMMSELEERMKFYFHLYALILIPNLLKCQHQKSKCPSNYRICIYLFLIFILHEEHGPF